MQHAGDCAHSPHPPLPPGLLSHHCRNLPFSGLLRLVAGRPRSWVSAAQLSVRTHTHVRNFLLEKKAAARLAFTAAHAKATQRVTQRQARRSACRHEPFCNAQHRHGLLKLAMASSFTRRVT
jgi:hypothetical protein